MHDALHAHARYTGCYLKLLESANPKLVTLQTEDFGRIMGKRGPLSGWLDGFAYLWRVTGASRQF
jgi:hypothetical protein